MDLIWLFGYQLFRYVEHLFHWDLFLYFWWNVKFLSNSFPWIQMLPMSKTWTFAILKNVCCCLVLHLLRIGPASLAIDHPPCARMIWIITTCLILRRCQSPISLSSTINLSVCFVNKPGCCSLNMSPRANFHQYHQISTPEKTNSCQHSTLSNLMSKRLKQVSQFFEAAHCVSSEVVVNVQCLRVFHRCFLMQ